MCTSAKRIMISTRKSKIVGETISLHSSCRALVSTRNLARVWLPVAVLQSQALNNCRCVLKGIVGTVPAFPLGSRERSAWPAGAWSFLGKRLGWISLNTSAECSCGSSSGSQTRGRLRAPVRMGSGIVRVAAQPRLASTNSRSSPPVVGQGATLWLQAEMAVTKVSLPGRSFLPGKGCAPPRGRCGMQGWAVREPLCPTAAGRAQPRSWVGPAPAFTSCCFPELAGTALVLPLNLFP